MSFHSSYGSAGQISLDISDSVARMNDVAVNWYRRNRDRSRRLFDLLGDDAYYTQPIALRHPIVFYEGHLPGFSFNTLLKKALGRESIDERLEALFARGIDPHESAAAPAADRTALWPTRKAVQAFADEADRQVMDALTHADLDRPGTRCWITPKRCSPSSSTRRCTRKRSFICGTGCPSARKRSRPAISHEPPGRRPASK